MTWVSDRATWVSDRALARLRSVADRPDATGTRYEIHELIGRGGMGAVYRALDRELGREVALKVLTLPEADASAVERLRREARILASLEHPGLVPVHDLGTLADGQVFYTMKLVRGQRLDVHAAEEPSLTARLRLFERVCEAVAFAHAHGVIHRDLKPANVMVGPFGEVLVLDWGVARVLASPKASEGAPSRTGGQGSGTAAGTVLGTAGYMSPEQERGDPVDARADVHALGAILHDLLGGRPPATSERGGNLPPAVPREAKAIVAKALAEHPDDRYASAAELADDVRRFVSQEPVAACPEGPIARTRRLVRKHQTAVALVAAYLLARAVLAILART